jgi:hypothetical protein
LLHLITLNGAHARARGRSTPDEWSVRRRDLWQLTTPTKDRHPCHRRDSNPQSQRAAADPSLRQRGNWGRHVRIISTLDLLAVILGGVCNRWFRGIFHTHCEWLRRHAYLQLLIICKTGGQKNFITATVLFCVIHKHDLNKSGVTCFFEEVLFEEYIAPTPLVHAFRGIVMPDWITWLKETTTQDSGMASNSVTCWLSLLNVFQLVQMFKETKLMAGDHVILLDFLDRRTETKNLSFCKPVGRKNADFFLFHMITAPSGPGPPHYSGFTITLRHTTLGRTPLDEWSAWRRDLYLIIQNTHNKQTSMLPAGFEPAIPASEQPQTHALDCAECRMHYLYISYRDIIRKFTRLSYCNLDGRQRNIMHSVPDKFSAINMRH